MSSDKAKLPKTQPAPVRPEEPAKPASVTPVKLPPLFRRIDWIIFAVTTLLVFIGYYITIAPDLTLEDSGELAVASYYAGVPHPPGYPVWTIYTWFFTVILPFSNIAWRVAVSSAVAGAFASGLISLMVSRGSSMMLEGIPDLKTLDKRLESAICMVSGFVAGMLIGFNGFMWSQAVIVEVYTLSALSLCGVLCLMLRWLYAPQQRKYLYTAFFLFGICFNNHQTLIVAAMGLEVLIAVVLPRLGRDMFLGNSLVFIMVLLLKAGGKISSFEGNKPLFFIFCMIGAGSIAAFLYLANQTSKLLSEWKTVLICGLTWLAGVSFYLYMPLAGMTNPPLNWGYPRTAEGFVHAFTRGQYERIRPTGDPFTYLKQIMLYVEGMSEEFNPVYLLVALIPFFFLKRMQLRERSWLIGLTGIYLCLGLILLALLNPTLDKQRRELTKVFFTSSHLIVAIGIGYGLTLASALFITQYEKSRIFGIVGGAVGIAFALYSLSATIHQVFADIGKGEFLFFKGLSMAIKEGQNSLQIYSVLYLLLLVVLFLVVILVSRKRWPVAIGLTIFALMPFQAVMSHWFDNEQRGHMFGYWFGHDMFTPPFNGKDGKPIYPEMDYNTILFGGTDPGRFNPTYMIFCESFIDAEDKKNTDPKFDRRDVYLITQNALADGTYLNYIRAHYNRSTQIDPPFFQEVFRSRREIDRGLKTNGLARMVSPLDRFFTGLGAKIEKKRRDRGVYPGPEINTPTPAESQMAFSQYLADAERRLAHDQQHPNEPKQIRPGEDVRIQDGKVQVSGQVAVMAINGILTKIIFDRNPTNAFYVEESFPLDWMYPHLTPYGIIMKINRQPLPELTEEIMSKDHEFWSQYSTRLIGNWITYDTPIKQICDFAEKTYLRRDFRGFTGDRKFIRDDNAQKAFSKLRSSIGGVYAWRMMNGTKSPEAQQRVMKEAEFSLKQAFAFCPFSPEAVYRYVNVLLSKNNVQAVDEALLIATTSLKFDQNNPAIENLIEQLKAIRVNFGKLPAVPGQLPDLENAYRANPSNMQTAFNLAAAYLQTQNTNRTIQVLNSIVTSPAADINAVLMAAQVFQQLANVPGLELSMQRLVALAPENPDYWYDLAGIKALMGKNPEALASLKKAIELNAPRLKTAPGSRNLAVEASRDPRFGPLQQNPEFKALLVQ